MFLSLLQLYKRCRSINSRTRNPSVTVLSLSIFKKIERWQNVQPSHGVCNPQVPFNWVRRLQDSLSDITAVDCRLLINQRGDPPADTSPVVLQEERLIICTDNGTDWQSGDLLIINPTLRGMSVCLVLPARLQELQPVRQLDYLLGGRVAPNDGVVVVCDYKPPTQVSSLVPPSPRRR